MNRFRVPNRVFFYATGFFTDCFNYMAILAEAFLAASVLGASEFQMGLLGAASALGYTIPCIGSGLLSERLGRRSMCIISVIGTSIAFLITPHVGSIYVLYAVAFCRSFAVGFFWSPLMAWMAETTERGQFSGLLGGYNVSFSAGILSGFFISGWTFEYVSPYAPFYIAALVASGMLLFLIFCTPRHFALTDQSHDVPPGDVKFFVHAGLLLNGLSYGLAALVLYLFPKVVGGQLGEADQGMLHVARMSGTVFAFAILSKTHAWHFRRGMIWLYFGLVSAGLILISTGQHYAQYLAGFALLGIGGGLSYMMSSYYALSMLRTKGLGSGIQESLIGGGNLVGPLYGGLLGLIIAPRKAILAGVLPIFVLLGYFGWLRRATAKDRGE